MTEEPLGLLLSHAPSLPAVQVTEVALLEVLVQLGGDEAGEQLLGELVMLNLALTLLVMLKHPHRLEADRAGQQLVRHAGVRLAATVNLAMCGLCVITAEKSHGRQGSSPKPGLSTSTAKALTPGGRPTGSESILVVMKPTRPASRRIPPNSPFGPPPAVPPAEKYAVRDQVTHDTYGLGRVIGVEPDIAVAVDFGSRRVRIVLPCAKLSKL